MPFGLRLGTDKQQDIEQSVSLEYAGHSSADWVSYSDADPASLNADADPASLNADADPASLNADADPASLNADPDPASLNADPDLASLNADPFFSRADLLEMMLTFDGIDTLIGAHLIYTDYAINQLGKALSEKYGCIAEAVAFFGAAAACSS